MRPSRGGVALRWGVFAVCVLVAVAGGLRLARANAPAERVATVVVVPHPDDEFQTWSLIENTPNQYKIFVVLTRGEETYFCEPEGLDHGVQKGLEPAPSPVPEGRSTSSCEAARMASLQSYLHRMSQPDPTIPGDFGAALESVVLPADGAAVCRADDGVTACDDGLRRATTWLDAQDRGAIISFNLGDGDLTSAEASWALQHVVDSRPELSINTDLPIRAMIGAFANSDHLCFRYTHPDHLTVHDALWRTDYGTGPRLAATCLTDPAAELTARVGGTSSQAAFEMAPDGTRIGAHAAAYGWLHKTYYPLAEWAQSALFMRSQSFWVRGND